MTDSPRRRYWHVLIIAVALVIVGASFFVGTWIGYLHRPAVEKVLNVVGQQQPRQFQNVDFNLFWEVWSQLEDRYVDKGKIDRQALVYGAISGLVRALKDPHSEFLPPAETKQFHEDIGGSFGGIGAEIGIRKDVLTIVAPLKDSPAERVGLKAGDKILKIDDTGTGDLRLDEAVRIIRGKPGTKVRLTILRDTFDKTKEFTITREVIKVPILTTEKKPDGIFIVKLHQFTENSQFEFRKVVKEFFSTNSQKLVFDLRNNPGGVLISAVDIASWFVPAGEVVVHEKRDGRDETYRSSGYRLFENIPTVVLINEGSASASEIVAAALRDHRGVKLIGTKTFGKGTVQQLFDLPKNSTLKLTIAKWLTPKGQEINGKGIEPDIKVELPKDRELETGEDPILEKGLEILKAL